MATIDYSTYNDWKNKVFEQREGEGENAPLKNLSITDNITNLKLSKNFIEGFLNDTATKKTYNSILQDNTINQTDPLYQVKLLLQEIYTLDENNKIIELNKKQTTHRMWRYNFLFNKINMELLAYYNERRSIINLNKILGLIESDDEYNNNSIRLGINNRMKNYINDNTIETIENTQND